MKRIVAIVSCALGFGIACLSSPVAAQETPVVVVIECRRSLDVDALRTQIGQAAQINAVSLLDVSPADASEVLTIAVGADRVRMQHRSPYGARSFAEVMAPRTGARDTAWVVAAALELLVHARGPGAFRLPSEVLDPFADRPVPTVATSYRLPTEVLDPWSSGRPMEPLERGSELSEPAPTQ